ncbi:hypothetical protein Q2941_17445 [Bradyrhizobium sp. UFLA05-153]
MSKVCGTYRESETYGFENIVALNGSSFICTHGRSWGVPRVMDGN